MVRQELPESDPRRHTANVRGMLNDVAVHLEKDIGKIEEPRAQALFETTREVLKGLITAFEHYDKGEEEAWKR